VRVSDPSDDPDEDADSTEWLDGIDWSEQAPSDGDDGETAVNDADGEPGTEAAGDTDDRRDPGAETADEFGDRVTHPAAGDPGGRSGGHAGSDGQPARTGPENGDRGSSSIVTGPEDADQDSPAATTDRITSALSEVRREVRKAAAVHAAAEGALVAVVVTLLLSLAAPAPLSGSVSLPGVVFGILTDLPVVGPVAPRTVALGSVVAVGVGGVVAGGAYLLRLRQPLIEQFEAANPPVREALRTARDAVDGGSDTEMARRLYADVIATLRETSTFELVDARRLTVTVVLVAVVTVASVQVAVINPDLASVLPGGNDPGAAIDRPEEDDELRDGDDILGDAADVESGDEVENITVPGTGKGNDDGPTAPGGGTGGGGGTGEFDSQQAGFAGDDRIEDAELVREYNLRIREFEEETQPDDDTA
jgi:hypothetical protein